MAVAYPRALVELLILDEDWGAGTADTHSLTLIPREVEVHRNDHRTADTARIVLDWRDFPMDPRTVRSCQVKILLGDVGSPDGELTDDDAEFYGFLDTAESRRAEDGSTVTLECRDATAPALDTLWPGGMVAVDVPLREAVDAVLREVPGYEGVVVAFSEGVSNTQLSSSIGRTKFAPQRDDDVWTVLSDLCGRVGLIPVFVLDVLFILTPDDFGVSRSLYLTNGEITPERATFTLGEDLTSLVVRRSLVEARQKQVEVRCWDETTRTASVVRYPTAPITTKKTIAADGKVTRTVAPIVPYYVTGTYSEAQLSALAERIWTTAAREEIALTLETRTMAPRLANGARITVRIAPSVALPGIDGLSQGEAVRALTTGSKPLDEGVAVALVAGYTKAKSLSVEFYAREVRHSWSREDGYRMTAELVNYVGGAA